MTREEFLEQLRISPKPTQELAIEIYNSALDHAAEKATAYAFPRGLATVNKDSILNLKIK